MVLPVEEFLRPFFEVDDVICLRAFSDRRDPVFRGAKMECTLGQIENMLPTLENHNQKERGIFFVVNTGGHEDAQITRINAQFMECDDGSFEEQWEKINAFPIQPSIVVRTRKSLHTYWLMRDAEVSRFRPIQKALAEYFGGDPMCVNESRVMRLPGFYHCKAEPVMVECVKFNPELRYTQAELAAVLPDIPEVLPATKVTPKGNRMGLDAVLQRCDFLKHCREDAGTLSEHDWYAMITNLAVFDGGDKMIHTLSSGYPGYNADETNRKITHFLKSGTRPMTCAVIAEKGFRCPKMEDGSCSCKVPAAMCYLPKSLDELIADVLALPVSTDPVANLIAARDFVTKHLYNIGPVDAKVVIGHVMKEHLRLKGDDLKTLLAAQKDLYRDHSAREDTLRAAAGDAVPDWYAIKPNGAVQFKPGLLAKHMAENDNAFYAAGSFYSYEGGVYTERENNWAKRNVMEHMIPEHTTNGQVMDAFSQWQVLVHHPVRDINPNPYILNLRNGLLNVMDGSFREHTPEYLSTVQIGAEYHPELRDAEDYGAPVFHRFLRSALDEAEIHLLQEIFGYLLVPINKAQKMFVFVGAASAGKSTLLSIVQEVLLGAGNVSNIPWQNLQDRFNKAELFGKLANTFADLPTKGIEDQGFLKALTGEDFITAEKKNRDPFSFRNYARLVFSCNDIPRNYGDRSEGFYRRLLIIRFSRSIPEDKRDPNLKEKLAREADGILMWALDGLKRLMENHYKFSETTLTRAEVERYKTESSSTLSFAAEFLEYKVGYHVERGHVYSSYKEYCRECGFKAMSEISFNRDIETQFPMIRRSQTAGNGIRTWENLYLKEDAPPAYRPTY